MNVYFNVNPSLFHLSGFYCLIHFDILINSHQLTKYGYVWAVGVVEYNISLHIDHMLKYTKNCIQITACYE